MHQQLNLIIFWQQYYKNIIKYKSKNIYNFNLQRYNIIYCWSMRRNNKFNMYKREQQRKVLLISMNDVTKWQEFDKYLSLPEIPMKRYWFSAESLPSTTRYLIKMLSQLKINCIHELYLSVNKHWSGGHYYKRQLFLIIKN